MRENMRPVLKDVKDVYYLYCNTRINVKKFRFTNDQIRCRCIIRVKTTIPSLCSLTFCGEGAQLCSVQHILISSMMSGAQATAESRP